MSTELNLLLTEAAALLWRTRNYICAGAEAAHFADNCAAMAEQLSSDATDRARLYVSRTRGGGRPHSAYLVIDAEAEPRLVFGLTAVAADLGNRSTRALSVQIGRAAKRGGQYATTRAVPGSDALITVVIRRLTPEQTEEAQRLVEQGLPLSEDLAAPARKKPGPKRLIATDGTEHESATAAKKQSRKEAHRAEMENRNAVRREEGRARQASKRLAE